MALPEMIPGQASVLVAPKAPTEPGEPKTGEQLTEAEFGAVCRRYFVDMAQLRGVVFGDVTYDTKPAEGDQPESWRASAMCSAL